MTKEITPREALDEINRLNRERDALSAQLAEAETGRDQALDSCFSWSERAKTAEARADAAEQGLAWLVFVAFPEAESSPTPDPEGWIAEARRVGKKRDEELRAAEAAAQRMRSALEAVEWVYDGWPDTNEWGDCPWCKGEQPKGHKPDCQRQAALSAATGTFPSPIVDGAA